MRLKIFLKARRKLICHLGVKRISICRHFYSVLVVIFELLRSQLWIQKLFGGRGWVRGVVIQIYIILNLVWFNLFDRTYTYYNVLSMWRDVITKLLIILADTEVLYFPYLSQIYLLYNMLWIPWKNHKKNCIFPI